MKSLLHCKTLHKEQFGSKSSKFVKENMKKGKCFTIDYQQLKPPYYHWFWFRKIVLSFTWVPRNDKYLGAIDWRGITDLSKRKRKCVGSPCCGHYSRTRCRRTCPPKYMWLFLEIFCLCLRYQYVREYWVKGSIAVLGMVSKFLSILFSKDMQKELNG